MHEQAKSKTLATKFYQHSVRNNRMKYASTGKIFKCTSTCLSSAKRKRKTSEWLHLLSQRQAALHLSVQTFPFCQCTIRTTSAPPHWRRLVPLDWRLHRRPKTQGFHMGTLAQHPPLLAVALNHYMLLYIGDPSYPSQQMCIGKPAKKRVSALEASA